MDARSSTPQLSTTHSLNNTTVGTAFGEQVRERFRSLAADGYNEVPLEQSSEALRHQRFNDARKLLRQRGVRYEGCRFHNFNVECDAQSKARDLAEEYVNNIDSHLKTGAGIIMFGPVGTGKDHLLAAMMGRAVANHGVKILWVTGEDLWSDMRASLDNESGLIRKYATPQVLAISDPIPPFGGLTEFQARTFYRIVDRRYSDCRPTWMTMNVSTGAEARSKIGQASVDRLTHNAVTINMDWASHRQKKGA